MPLQLFLNATSPFARLARVVALEKGLGQRLQLVACDPWNNDPALLAQHPQARIPVLVTDSGTAIAESLLIAQYLDHLGTGPALAQLEATTLAPLGSALTLDQIATVVALAYVQFRLPELLQPTHYPQLHAWLQQAEQRPALAQTRFA